jgi:L-fuconolactonase
MTRLIDAHVHASERWYEPVERLIEQLDANEVAAAVLVQDAASADDAYLFACLERFPGRFAVVGVVDLVRADAPGAVRRLAARGASGVRLPAAIAGDPVRVWDTWRTAADEGLVITCHGQERAFADPRFRELALTVPDTAVVAEHLAGAPTIETETATPEERLTALRGLAAIPHAYLKFHGLGEFAPRALPAASDDPFRRPIPRLLDEALALMGPERMMWGSDFPPVSQREGYRNALRLPMDHLRAVGPGNLDAMFGAVAARVFRLGLG